ncbi:MULTISPECIES: 2-isopropylmalate synthase [Microvirgula]|uniref:2-isopropylmalate synthase n=1 Tax=Microvirgula aerodenitrificans TaxID=57480 RepID=A0A2S0P995_9NEIS|nr:MULTISPECIES: 2-isopropylmalate synthase [Microvirgula]AVY93912.1 2-isopropylmalate synthase [Microvirgula aerodenitrificans]RAS13297.1 2-isopropylmalate synthase [Microvirgula sp. AG722]
MSLDIAKLIDDFGGPATLADALTRAWPEEPISRAAVYKWRARGGLPQAQLNKLAQLAAQQGRRFDLNTYLLTASAPDPRRNSEMSDRLYIFDTTLRDGEQSPGAAMTKEEKIRIARQLERLGVDIIEAGFAAASPGDAEAIHAIAGIIKDSTVCSLARANERDVRAAGEAIQPAAKGRIHIFIATSPIHMEKKLRMTPDEVVAAAVSAIAVGREYTDDIEFSAEDAVRSDIDFLIRIFEAVIKAGARTINVPDTVGYSIPSVWQEHMRTLIARVPGADQVIWSTHCHNDLGMAVANSLAAIQGGARQVECTINGLGERAGNASLEEIVMAIKTRKDVFGLETRIDATQIVPTSKLVSTITGYPVQPNKAIVGANAFSHESGIHQDGVLKHRETYEIMSAESVGWSTNRLTLGKLSGRNAFRTKLTELGIEIASEVALNAAFARFKELADRKREIFDEDLLALANEELSAHEPEAFRFVSLKLATETGESPRAEIVFNQQGQECRAESSGSGLVDATFKAIESVASSGSELELYSVNAITQGTDSQGEVTVRLARDGRVVNGQGADTDIIVASAKAYLSALNKLSQSERLHAQHSSV